MEIKDQIRFMQCDTVGLLEGCVDLQRRVFDMPEVEISPVRHFIVTMHAGGFTLGAFLRDRLIGFCLSVPALLDGKKALYSHMTAVDAEFQGMGIGAKLKWNQRKLSLERGIRLIKWTFQPEKVRNAYFNLEKLGAEVRDYMPNFYGTDYGVERDGSTETGIDSDRLFAVWRLDSEKVSELAANRSFTQEQEPAASVGIPWNWGDIVRADRPLARETQERIRSEFTEYLSKGLVCRSFVKDRRDPRYLFFAD